MLHVIRRRLAGIRLDEEAHFSYTCFIGLLRNFIERGMMMMTLKITKDSSSLVIFHFRRQCYHTICILDNDGTRSDYWRPLPAVVAVNSRIQTIPGKQQ
jgi:hypothetical protein